MKNKKMIAVFTVITFVIIVLLVLVINNKDHNKSENKVTESASNSNSSQTNKYVNELQPNDKGEIEFTSDELFNSLIKHTFISYDFIPGSEIGTQTKYSEEYLTREEDFSKSVTYENIVDYDTIKKENPEFISKFEEVAANSDKYSEEEINEVILQYDELERKYRNTVEYEKAYVFVKCRFVNELDKENNLILGNIGLYQFKDGILGFDSHIIYFDKMQNPGSEHEEGDYMMQPHETLECTVGYVLTNARMMDGSCPSEDNCFMGYHDLELEDDYRTGKTDKPSVYSKYMFKLSDLKKSEK